jgi:hypothetical protein
MTTSPGVPTLARALCDDASLFPPVRVPLTEAVPAHARHRRSGYAELVGPFVVPAARVADLTGMVDDTVPWRLAITAPGGPDEVGPALADAATLPVDVCAVEVAIPPGMGVDQLATLLDRAGAARGGPTEDLRAVFLEVPRDARRAEVLAVCASSGFRAKFRTGGTTADLYPDEVELAAAVHAAVAARVPFKATAGLHHAVRNTDPETGFEQHGFLNVLLAVDAALAGADPSDVQQVLADRDGFAVAAAVAALDEVRVARVRDMFLSFGTCSVSDPVDELVELGLLPRSVLDEERDQQEVRR